MKYSLTAIILLVISNTSLAIPIDLGAAGNYTLLATGSGGWYGDLDLGSTANINGNVGARNSLYLGDSATVSGNASYGNLTLNPNASINGSSTQEGSSFWDNLHSDLRSISDQAYGYIGIDKGYIGASQTFESQGSLSVFDISGLSLGTGSSLTLAGNAGDQFIINVGNWGLIFGSGASIILDGISANDVLFNLGSGGITAGAGSYLQGNFIAPDGFFALGSGLNLTDTRFLGAGFSGGSALQIAGTPLSSDPPHQPPSSSTTTVSEPSSLSLMAFSLLILGFYLGQPKIRSAASAAYASQLAI